jgi:hypothetical protein
MTQDDNLWNTICGSAALILVENLMSLGCMVKNSYNVYGFSADKRPYGPTFPQ